MCKLVVSCRKDGYVLPNLCMVEQLGMTIRMFRQTMYRSEAFGQDRIHLRVLVYRLRYLREEVSYYFHTFVISPTFSPPGFIKHCNN